MSALQALADALTFFLNVPTADKTNLGGIYDYTLKLHIDLSAPGGTGQRGDAASVGEGWYPPISTALQEQLGLRLEAQKVQVRTLVIDHLERPTEN